MASLGRSLKLHGAQLRQDNDDDAARRLEVVATDMARFAGEPLPQAAVDKGDAAIEIARRIRVSRPVPLSGLSMSEIGAGSRVAQGLLQAAIATP